VSGLDVLIQKSGRTGRIQLNRPKALNALTVEMIDDMQAALDGWHADPDVDLIILDAVPGRAFCAGGDIGALYHAGINGDYAVTQNFWRREYWLDATIAFYPKPVVVICDGIVMGGGAGISMHASNRVVTENMQFAMPECGIGLVPDVGATLKLSTVPGKVGEYLGLSGARIGPGDCIWADLADAYVLASDVPALIERLAKTGAPDAIKEFAAPAPDGTLQTLQPEIDAAFSGEDMDAILTHLRQSSSDWAKDALARIEAGSPFSLVLTLRMIAAARKHGSLSEALKAEYRAVSRAAEYGEFLEGTRAQIIDKDRTPIWSHATPGEVPAALLDEMLSPPPDGDLRLPEGAT
jgi:enoyl-CoA hydratase/carnithine racemase